MKKNRRLIYLLTAILGLTLLTGVLHGRVSGRWGAWDSVALDAKARLEQLPARIGDWQSVRDLELESNAIDMLKLITYRSRIYRSNRTGEMVSVTVMFGPKGPLLAHTPKFCMPEEYKLVDTRNNPSNVPIGGGTTQSKHDFWRGTYEREGSGGELVRVYYAWTVGQNWTAPTYARLRRWGSPYIYKIHVQFELPPGSKSSEEDSGKEFLRAFVEKTDELLLPLREG